MVAQIQPMTVAGRFAIAGLSRAIASFPEKMCDLVFAYAPDLPKEKILVEADDFSWPAGTRAGPRYRANNVNLYRNIQQLKLDVKTIAPLHGEPVPLSELQKAATTS